MTRRDRFTDDLEEYLDEYEGPPDLPDMVRNRILAELPNTKQSGRFGPRRYPHMNPLSTTRVQYGLAAAVAGVALVGAALVFGGGRGIGGPSEAPSVSPQSSATAVAGTAATFVHPFTYTIDPSTGLERTAFDAEIYNFRVPARAPGEGYDEGVIVHTAAEGLRTDVCSASGGDVNTDPTAQDFIDLVTSLEGIDVSEPTELTVDGLPALAVSVSNEESRPCDYYVYENFEPPFAWDGNQGFSRRIVAVDVDGDLVILAITATTEHFDAWLPHAEAFIDSIDFLGQGE